MFDWNVLPVAGGIFDQDPVWLDSVRTINSVIADVEKREEDKKKQREQWKKSGYAEQK